MAVTFVQKVADTIGNLNATRTTTMPSTAGPPSIPVDGNLLIGAMATSKGSTVTYTAPSNNGGFSAADVDISSGATSSKMQAAAYHKTAASESGVAYIWTVSQASPIEVVVIEVSGQDTVTPIVGAISNHDVSTLAGVTTTRNGNLIVVGAVMDTGANTITGVSDVQGNTYTQRDVLLTTSGTHDPNFYLFTAPQATAGSTGTITFTVSGSTLSNVLFAYAVQPPNPNTAHLLALTGVGS
jgi:hypothetical protein